MLLDDGSQGGEAAGFGLAWDWVAARSLLLEVDGMLE
jgi:hypothetical protein